MSALQTYDGIRNPLLNGINAFNRIKLPAGEYSGGSFQNLKNVIIDASDAVFIGQVRYGNNHNFQFLNETFKNVGGGACRLWQGWNAVGVVKGGKMDNCGVVNELEEKNRVYNGNRTDFVMDSIEFHDEVANNCDMYWLGTYAGGWEPKGYCYKIQGYNIQTNDTKSNGTQWRGTIYDFYFYNCTSRYTKNNGINPVLGDVGYFYLTGFGDYVKCGGSGGRGYVARHWQCWVYMLINGVRTLIGRDTTARHCVKSGTNTYGGFDWRPTEQAGPWEYRGGNIITENHTMFNLKDSIGYWCPINVIGNLAFDDGRVMHVYSKNHLGAALAVKPGQDAINSQQSDVANWNKADAAGSQYFSDVAGHIDPNTGASLVAGVGADLNIEAVAPGSSDSVVGGGTSTPPVTTPPVTTPPVTTPPVTTPPVTTPPVTTPPVQTPPVQTPPASGNDPDKDAQTKLVFIRSDGSKDTYRYKLPAGKHIQKADIKITYTDASTESHTAKATKQ
jgi:hypothetical protein